jgi:putative transposase
VRRACTLFSVARSTLRYQGRKVVKDAAVIGRMKEFSAQYPRYGYRRTRIFLGRDGYRMSPGRTYRLWRAAGLQLPRKRPRKRVAATRLRPQAPCGPNQVWSYDFLFDHCANGQQLKCLTVTDEFTKEGPAIDVDGRIRSPRVIGTHPVKATGEVFFGWAADRAQAASAATFCQCQFQGRSS